MLNRHIRLITITGTFIIITLYKQNRNLRYLNDEHDVALNESVRLLAYFADMLDRNDIEISEFDMIALNSFVDIEDKRL